MIGLLPQACSPAGPIGSGARVYAVDLSGGAKVCDVPKVTPIAGQTLATEIKLGNDGGWCGLTVWQPGPKPFDAGLLLMRPAHGNVVIHEVGDDTRIDYTPEHGFSGSDKFAVKLIPGNAIINIAVMVKAPTQNPKV
ncbi:hypothetical protein [Rhodopila sp.]|uniref:hypothetical protein n=1 Tax=Rhodopila sp. TaxID=2480087 RepID=UPI003D0B9EA2